MIEKTRNSNSDSAKSPTVPPNSKIFECHQISKIFEFSLCPFNKCEFSALPLPTLYHFNLQYCLFCLFLKLCKHKQGLQVSSFQVSVSLFALFSSSLSSLATAVCEICAGASKPCVRCVMDPSSGRSTLSPFCHCASIQ